jgi:hypothetical protein
MANNTKGRGKEQRFHIGSPLTYGAKISRPARKGTNQGIDGIDRRSIDELAEDAKDRQLMGEVWDE